MSPRHQIIAAILDRCEVTLAGAARRAARRRGHPRHAGDRLARPRPARGRARAPRRPHGLRAARRGAAVDPAARLREVLEPRARPRGGRQPAGPAYRARQRDAGRPRLRHRRSARGRRHASAATTPSSWSHASPARAPTSPSSASNSSPVRSRSMPEKIVLAYSGGLDTSVALRWLADEYRAEVVALLVDVGQGIDVERIGARAPAAGASDVVVIDARAEFAEQYVLPTLQAGALYEGTVPARLGALAAADRAEDGRGRPRARRRRGGARLHRQGQRPGALRGCRRGARAGPRRARAGARLGHDARAGDRLRRPQHGIEVPVKSGAAYSIDANLWGRSIECGPLEDPWTAPPEDAVPADRRPDDGAGRARRRSSSASSRACPSRSTARSCRCDELIA